MFMCDEVSYDSYALRVNFAVLSLLASVTRFGEKLLLWQKFQSIDHYLRVYLIFGKNLNLFWQFFAIVPFFVAVNMPNIEQMI